MIYLFDDNKYRQMSQNYEVNYVEELKKYADIIQHIQSHDAYRERDKILKNADCILIHNSFSEEIQTERIKAESRQNNIPLVVFSNQFTGTVFGNKEKTIISEIKKDRMYFNLIPFIEYYESNGIIRLEILSLGKNYEVKKAKIIDNSLAFHLYRNLNNFEYYKVFYDEPPKSDADIEGLRKFNAWKDLKELFYFVNKEKTFEDIEAEELEHISAEALRKKIKELIHKVIHIYGQQDSCY